MFNANDVILINRIVGEEGLVIKPNELHSAFASLDYIEELELKVAYVVRSVMQNHPFKDGNKRTGVCLLVAGLSSLGIKISKTDEEFIHFVTTSVTQHWSPEQILEWAKS